MSATCHFIKITFSALILFSLNINAQHISPSKIIPYKKINTEELKLHIFNPEKHKAEDQKPAIVFFFGGGWVGGSPKQFYAHADAFAKEGYVAVSVDYRVKKSPFICVEDGKSAIRWIRANAAMLGIDPDHIIAAGGSAGGHVAACIGVIDGLDVGKNLEVSSKPSAMILYNPVIDTTEKGYGIDKVGKERKTDISPAHHVKKGIVPTLIFHGTADTTVPYENAKRFTKLMTISGNQCTLISFKGKGHGFFNSKHFRPKKSNKDFDSTMISSLEFLRNIEPSPNKE